MLCILISRGASQNLHSQAEYHRIRSESLGVGARPSGFFSLTFHFEINIDSQLFSLSAQVMAGEAKLSTGPCTRSLPQGSRRASSHKPLNSPRVMQSNPHPVGKKSQTSHLTCPKSQTNTGGRGLESKPPGSRAQSLTQSQWFYSWRVSGHLDGGLCESIIALPWAQILIQMGAAGT